MNECKVIDLEVGWYFIMKGITKLKKILEGHPEPQFTATDIIILYTTIFNMCTQHPPHDCSQQLYARYRKLLEEYMVLTVLPSIRAKHGEFMLREFVQRWSNHKIMVKWLSRFFDYLDRFFVAIKSLPSLNEVGHACFHDLVYQEVNDNIRDLVLSLIFREREGEQIDRALLKNVIYICVEISNDYESFFEEFMLRDTAAYYAQKASNWIVEDSCPYYMQKVEECLKSERGRLHSYLHVVSDAKLLKKVQNELLSVYSTQLLEKEHSGCQVLLKDDKVDDLSRMYRLFSLIPKGLEIVCSMFKQNVIVEVNVLVKQAEDPTSDKKVFVRKVIELFGKFLKLVNVCFNGDILLYKEFFGAFKIFFDKDVAGSISSELLATYCDDILKSGCSLSDEAIENALENVVKLLYYIDDKDLFIEFCRRKFARRFLFYKGSNLEHARSFLKNLNQCIGYSLTSKIETMFRDITLATGNQSHFKEYLSNNSNVNLGIDLRVTVLTTISWPSYTASGLNLPAEMVECVKVFEEYYQTITKNRKLTWTHSLGTCYIIGKFEERTMELIVTPYQASALLLFNLSDRLSYKEIMTQLNLSDADIVRILHSLSCEKYKILLKEPNTKTIAPTDNFEFNLKFTDKKSKIKIPFPPVGEKKKVIMDVYKERRYAIEALIVRIMKSRKLLGYQELIQQCTEQLGLFAADANAIKMCIENLITRDYLERDRDNRFLIRYLAISY